jgi:hypothetical protein
MRNYISIETLKCLYIKKLTESTKDHEAVQALAHQKKYQKDFNKMFKAYISTLIEAKVLVKNDGLDQEFTEFPYYIKVDSTT